ncbi:MAG: hypothetical protein E2O46_05085, partial [Ignavibacteria bacterium]
MDNDKISVFTQTLLIKKEIELVSKLKESILNDINEIANILNDNQKAKNEVDKIDRKDLILLDAILCSPLLKKGIGETTIKVKKTKHLFLNQKSIDDFYKVYE